jgi:hypothetical protein
MPWIIISANGEELDRRDLVAAVVLGRSSECDVAIRDILLSRTHCRIEPCAGGWKVVDLNSKNGTRVGWQGIQTHVLRPGDHLRMGRTRIEYLTTPFEPAPVRVPRTDRMVRPADPHEALSGTVTDFILLDEEEPGVGAAFDSYADHPYPQPRTLDPVDETAAAVNPAPVDDVASSFWYRNGETSDVAMATMTSPVTALAVRPRVTVRALPRMSVKPIYREIRQLARSETDLSLQADSISTLSDDPIVIPLKSPRRSFFAAAGVVTAAVLGTAVAMASIWLLTLAQ